MNDILKKECDIFIEKFNLFSREIKHINKGLDLSIIKNVILPADYKYLLSFFNGFSLMGTEVFGYEKMLEVKRIEQNEVECPMPIQIIPFSPDGRGNHYCFNMNRYNKETGVCPIVFWQYCFSNKNNIETVNSSFIEWANEVIIEWTLENYDFDGKER